MAAVAGANAPTTTPETSVTVKVAFDGSNRKFKLPLKDLGATVFPEKIRSLLQVPSNQNLKLERFSDSSASFITLDINTPSTYKQLYRAAKAKQKLRLRATVEDTTSVAAAAAPVEEEKKEVEQPVQTPTAASYPTPLPYHSIMASAPAPTSENLARTRQELFNHLSRTRNFSRVSRDTQAPIPASSWQVFCNACDKPMADAHFHCSICDDGDYDLCETCVENGKLCPGDGHWLIKRFIKNGRVINSTTERIAPKPKPQPLADQDKAKEMPGAFNSEIKLEPAAPESEASRTCNCCVRTLVLPEKLTVTCLDCDDYDICMACHVDNKHGHHPAHTFKPTSAEVQPSAHVASLCAPGRNMRHAAICDGCDKSIVGVRHKCLNCPDWDYCGDCFEGALTSHPSHRFVPVYEALNAPRASAGTHYGIYCDGPLCKDKPNQRYVQGVRYKCAICHDTDFCANCEAHPSNEHNVTHPLIKFKTQVRNVSVTTLGENKDGEPLSTMGDRRPSTRYSTALSPRLANMRTPSTATLPPYTPQEFPKATEAGDEKSNSVEKTTVAPTSELDAQFVTDTVTDGAVLPPDTIFTQTWTLRNPGPYEWPVGCSVRNVGGDNMLNLDRDRPSSVAALAEAQESNINESAVMVNDVYSFSVTMRTPSREGRHISYWRLKAADGTPFGHKLWCDIEVKKGTAVVEPIDLGKMTPNQLCDYQKQLMLLEQQNKKRLMLARQEHDMLSQDTAPKSHQTSIHQYLTPPIFKVQSEVPKGVETESAQEATENVTSSTMVFPKLEKESPASSTYADAGTTLGPVTDNTSTAPTEVATGTSPEEETFEDVQSIDSDDDGDFLTDDEYDILCASDEEAVNGANARA